MSNFENESFQPKQLTPESFETKSHLILRNPLEIDLNQPNRAEGTSFKEITGSGESKLVAEIVTPTDHIGILCTSFPGAEPLVMLVGNDEASPTFLNPGDELDLSEKVGEGKCIVSMDQSGQHVYVHAEKPDGSYQISTRQLEQYKVPASEDFSDDPES